MKRLPQNTNRPRYRLRRIRPKLTERKFRLVLRTSTHLIDEERSGAWTPLLGKGGELLALNPFTTSCPMHQHPSLIAGTPFAPIPPGRFDHGESGWYRPGNDKFRRCGYGRWKADRDHQR